MIFGKNRIHMIQFSLQSGMSHMILAGFVLRIMMDDKIPFKYGGDNYEHAL